MFSGASHVVKIEVCIPGSGAISSLEYYDCIPPTGAHRPIYSEEVPYTTDAFSTLTSDLGGFTRLENSLPSSDPRSPPGLGITTCIVIVTIITAAAVLLGSRFWGR
jgi:hypothetical protein